MRAVVDSCRRWVRGRSHAPKKANTRVGTGLSQAQGESTDNSYEEDSVPSPEDYPIFPPPSPRDILLNPHEYWSKVEARKFAAPQGIFEDSPLFALYRLYEFVVLDRRFAYRNALEAFWRRSEWGVQQIPDPRDDDAERYAFLAGCTYLLVRSFNERVKLGLKRDSSPLITPEEAEMARSVPLHLRRWETVPEWAERAPPLDYTLKIPTEDGITLQSKADPRADPDFMAKNILLWTPHIFFT